MDETFELNGIVFTWNREKALGNEKRHGVTFEQSAEAFPAQDGTVPRRGLFRLDGRVVIDAGMGPLQIVVLD